MVAVNLSLIDDVDYLTILDPFWRCAFFSFSLVFLGFNVNAAQANTYGVVEWKVFVKINARQITRRLSRECEYKKIIL